MLSVCALPILRVNRINHLDTSFYSMQQVAHVSERAHTQRRVRKIRNVNMPSMTVYVINGGVYIVHNFNSASECTVFVMK